MTEINSNESLETSTYQFKYEAVNEDSVDLNDVQIKNWTPDLSDNTTPEICSIFNLVENCNIVDISTGIITSPQIFNVSTTNKDDKINKNIALGTLFEGLYNTSGELTTNELCSEISCDKISCNSDSFISLARNTNLNPISKIYNLPFVKISKDCLLKGKIIGKGDLSLLSKNNGFSFLSMPPENNTLLTNSHENASGLQESISVDEMTLKSFTIDSKDHNHSADVKKDDAIEESKVEDLVNLQEIREQKSTTRVQVLHNEESSNITSKVTENKKTTKLNSLKKTSISVPLAFVKISSNESDNTTEIVVRTEEGENVNKGKTKTDFSKSIRKVNKGNAHNTGVLKMREPTIPIKNYDEAAVTNLFTSLLGVSDKVLENYEGTLPLQCPVVGCTFTNPKGSSLKLHILQHYGIRPFKCDFPGCTWAFYTNFRLKRHQNVHQKKEEYLCPHDKCGRSFSTIYNLNTHLKLHERPFSVMCKIDECNRAFQTRKSYERHLRDHGIEHAPYKCEKCGNRYFTINSLNSHSRIHQHKIESLQCAYCGKIFDQPCRLKAHMNSHTGTKPYKCQLCSWAFTTSSKLRRHERKHSQNRKHVCTVCGKTYLRAEHLKDHSLHHFVKKSFVCPEPDCNLVLSNKSSMYSHLKRHRTGTLRNVMPVNFPCPVLGCYTLFETKDGIETHLQDDHIAERHVSESEDSENNIMSEENLSTFEGLQNNNTSSSSGPGFVSFNSTSQEGLLVGMSDIVQCIPPIEQGDFSESNSSSNVITQVVFADDIGDEDNVSQEPQVLITEIEDEIGSADNGLVFEALSDLKDNTPTTSPISITPRHTASDVVLSAASQDILLQDELTEGDLYMGAEECLGELQVLLLDPATRLQHSDFEQSTINLRDLE